MALTPQEEAELEALTTKAAEVEKVRGIKAVLHALIGHAGSGPVHDELHEAVDAIDTVGPPGPAGPPGKDGKDGKDAESPAVSTEPVKGEKDDA